MGLIGNEKNLKSILIGCFFYFLNSWKIYRNEDVLGEKVISDAKNYLSFINIVDIFKTDVTIIK